MYAHDASSSHIPRPPHSAGLSFKGKSSIPPTLHYFHSNSPSRSPSGDRPTLSRDDDFISHLLVEKLGTGAFPLVVHKMDPTRKLPKTDADKLMQIVRRVSLSSLPPPFPLFLKSKLNLSFAPPLLPIARRFKEDTPKGYQRSRGRVAQVCSFSINLLFSCSLFCPLPVQLTSVSLPSSQSPVRYYLRDYTQKQINAFATYAPLPPLSLIPPNLFYPQSRF